MAKRVALEVLLILVITIVIAWLSLAILSLFDGGDPVAAFVDEAPRMLFGVMGIALAMWAVLIVIGAIVTRERSPRWKVMTHLISLTISIAITIVVFTVIAFADGAGWGLLLVGIALVSGVIVGAAGTIAVLVVELRVLRGAAAVGASAAPVVVDR